MWAPAISGREGRARWSVKRKERAGRGAPVCGLSGPVAGPRGREAGRARSGPGRKERKGARGKKGGEGLGLRARMPMGKVFPFLLFFSFSFNSKPISKPFKNLFEIF